MPLDPSLLVCIFKALKTNFVLQELILTDESLQYCTWDVYCHLFEAIQNNQYSALTLIDFSRNYHSFDEKESVH